MTAPESALEDVRAEWVASSEASDGTPEVPTDPEWDRFSDAIEEINWSEGLGLAAEDPPVGSGDVTEHFRGSEEHDIELTWWMQRMFVDSGNSPNDPVGEIIEHQYGDDPPQHEVLLRQTKNTGGNDGAGRRIYIYGSGCKPITGEVPGDPGDVGGLPVTAGYACEKVREYVIHQPSDSTQLDIVSTDANDTMDITIESDGASTAETISLSGTTTVTTTSSFDSIDAIWLASEPAGDVTIQDDSAVTILEDGLIGSNSQNVEGDRGIPPLGSGSHSSAINATYQDFQILNTTFDYGGNDLAQSPADERNVTADITLEIDEDRNPRAETRRQIIDYGARTATADIEVMGPYESQKYIYDVLTQRADDFNVNFANSNTLTINSAHPIEVDDIERTGGDANAPVSITLQGEGEPAVSASNS